MEKISKPGLYELTMDEYHSDCCVGPSVSASVLHTIISECPAIYWGASYLNPNRVPDDSTPAFDAGRAAHALVLGEPEFAKYFVISPYDDFRTKEARAWRDAETRTVIKAELFETIKAMANAQIKSPQVARAFQDGKPEQSLIWLDGETGVWLKSRPDWLPNNPMTRPLTQYKTARTLEPRLLGQAAFAYGYHLGAALELDAVRNVLGVSPMGISHVIQEKSVPYLAELRMFDGDGIEYGRREYRRALRIFAECWNKHLAGKPEREAWPGYTTSPAYIEIPPYIRKKMENPDVQGTASKDYARNSGFGTSAEGSDDNPFGLDWS